MLIKKYSNLLLAGILSMAIMSCDDDSVPVVGDSEDPTATFTSPTTDEFTIEQGSTFTLAGTVQDNRDLETVTLTITADDGTRWIDTTWNESNATFDNQTLTLNESITVPTTANAGTHVMSLTATDDAGNSFTKSWTITVTEIPMVTFNLTIPEAVTDPIFIAGELMDPDGTTATWTQPGQNTDFQLTRVDDLNYTITLPVRDSNDTPGVIEYKYFLGGGWGGGEVLVTCEPAPNRTINVPTADTQTTDVVPAWETTCQ